MNSIVSKIMMYFNDYLFPPKYGWNFYYARERSYERWAAGYIIDKVLENDDMSGIKVIQEIELYFKEAAQTTTCKEQRYLFEVAYETAKDILNTIEKENKR